MDLKTPRNRESSQEKYRKKRLDQGFVRFEIQVRAQSKQRFEEMASVLAEEYDAPWDPRQRKAMARADVFDEVTKGVTNEFFALKATVSALKQEVRALAPNFFVSGNNRTPLPSAIDSLPDNPKELKLILAKIYREAQSAKRESKESVRKANQFERLYNTSYEENEALLKKIRAIEEAEL